MKIQLNSVNYLSVNRLHAFILGITLIMFLCKASADEIKSTFEKKEAMTTLTLSKTIQRILTNNPELKGFEYLKQQWQGQKETAALKPELRLHIGADNVLGSAPYTGISQSELSMSLSSVIETGKKRYWRSQQFEQQIHISDFDQQLATLDVLANASQIHITLLSIQAQIKLLTSQFSQAEKNLAMAQSRFKKGVAFEAEVFRAKADLKQLKLSQMRLQSEHQNWQLKLVNFWGSSTADFETVTGDLMSFNQLQPLDVLLIKIDQSPYIQRFSAANRLQEIKRQQINASSKSDFNWQLGINRIQESQDTAITAGFSIPLFKKKRNMGMLSANSAQSAHIGLQQQQQALTLKTQLRLAYQQRETAMTETQQLKNDVIPWLKKAHQETLKAFQIGRYSYQELLNVQQQVFDAERQLIEAATATHRQAITIEQLSAQSLDNRNAQ